MTAFALSPDLQQRKADHDFFVANWPERLQRASQIERRLLWLMSHPCYTLRVSTDTQGIDRLHVTPSPGMPSPVTEAAREYIQTYRADLIAFVRYRDGLRERTEAA